MSSSHGRVRLRDCRVFEMRGMQDRYLDATDSRNRSSQIIKRAFRDLCGYFDGKTDGAPGWVGDNRPLGLL